MASIGAIFNESQASVASHRKGVLSMRKLHATMPAGQFDAELAKSLHHVLTVFKREPAVERIVGLVGKFVKYKEGQERTTADEATDGSIMRLLSHLIQFHNAKDKAVRFRVCQLVAEILSNMDEEVDIDDDVWDQVKEAMLTRLNDKIPLVRQHAALALNRMQDPDNAKCPIVSEYIRMLSKDTSKDVRKAVLTSLGVTKLTLPHILERLHDTSEEVRGHALEIVGYKMEMRALTLEQRIDVLRTGLDDRASSLRDVCAKMLHDFWLRRREGDIVEMLKGLDVVEFEDYSLRAVTTILEYRNSHRDTSVALKMPAATLMATEAFTPAAALFWRAYCEYNASKKNDALENVLPVASEFCTLISKQLNSEDEDADFVSRQLLAIARHLDFSDEMGRRNIIALTRSTLQNFNSHAPLVEDLLKLMAATVPDENERLRSMGDIVSEIRFPLVAVETKQQQQDRRTRDLKAASTRVRIEELRDEKTVCARSEDFERAAQIKKEMDELEALLASLQEPEQEQHVRADGDQEIPALAWLRCLAICEFMFGHTSQTMHNQVLGSMLQTVVIKAVQSVEPTIRDGGVRCMGLCCLLMKPAPVERVVLFVQALRNDEDAIKVTAMKVLFDLLMVFGTAPFAPKPEEGSDEAVTETLVDVLAEYLTHEDTLLRTVAVEGFARLLFTNTLTDPKIFCNLVVLFFNPTTEDDARLRQCLSVFFPSYAFAASSRQALIESTFMHVLRAFVKSPKSSPLRTVALAEVAKFLLYLTDVNNLVLGERIRDNSTTAHERMGVEVANEILLDAAANIKTYGKVLSLFSVRTRGTENAQMVASVTVLGENLLKEISDKRCRTIVQKFANISDNGAPVPTRAVKGDDADDDDEDAEEDIDEDQENRPVSKKSAKQSDAPRPKRQATQRKTAYVDKSSESSSTPEESSASTAASDLVESSTKTAEVPAVEASKTAAVKVASAEESGSEAHASSTSSSEEAPAARGKGAKKKPAAKKAAAKKAAAKKAAAKKVAAKKPAKAGAKAGAKKAAAKDEDESEEEKAIQEIERLLSDEESS